MAVCRVLLSEVSKIWNGNGIDLNENGTDLNENGNRIDLNENGNGIDLNENRKKYNTHVPWPW